MTVKAKPVRCRAFRCTVLLLMFGFIVGAIGCGGKEEASTNASDAKEAQEQEEAKPLVGIDLGPFHIREMRARENQKINLRFTVQAAVQEADKERMEELVEQKKNLLRDQVITAIRTAETTEFDDPELTRLRRRIVLRIAGKLNDSIVEDLFLTDFHCQID